MDSYKEFKKCLFQFKKVKNMLQINVYYFWCHRVSQTVNNTVHSPTFRRVSTWPVWDVVYPSAEAP